MKILKMIMLRCLRIMFWCVITQRYKFNSLQPHDPKSLGPTAVITNTHANFAAKHLMNLKT
ncbi:uncharacterized protein METZ01_LOCUS75504 [marine metagenome]|uniref:Uncharacterized protein n=1 Tax=marine metagenome TaxID=408172 RepID=A0A381U337_9ZZZZ